MQYYVYNDRSLGGGLEGLNKLELVNSPKKYFMFWVSMIPNSQWISNRKTSEDRRPGSCY